MPDDFLEQIASDPAILEQYWMQMLAQTPTSLNNTQNNELNWLHNAYDETPGFIIYHLGFCDPDVQRNYTFAFDANNKKLIREDRLVFLAGFAFLGAALKFIRDAICDKSTAASDAKSKEELANKADDAFHDKSDDMPDKNSDEDPQEKQKTSILQSTALPVFMSGLASHLTGAFSFLDQTTATMVATTVLVLVARAGHHAFCKVTDEEFLKELRRKAGHDQPLPPPDPEL